jgi:hypothetical protein
MISVRKIFVENKSLNFLIKKNMGFGACPNASSKNSNLHERVTFLCKRKILYEKV